MDMRLFRDLRDVYDLGNDKVRVVVRGIWFFLGATFVLWSIGCPNPYSGCSGADPHAVALLAGLIEFVLIVLLAWPRGRWFDGGFCLALVAGSLFTGGMSTAVWRAPFVLSASSTPSKSELRAAKKEWVRLHRLQQPRLVHGARLANRLNGCVEAFRAADATGSYPRAESEVTSLYACDNLGPLTIGADSARMRYTDSDNGWRWSYTAGPADSSGRVTNFRVRVFEDPVLERPAPAFIADQHGAILQSQPGAPLQFVASPVPALLTLRTCLTRVPAFEERTRKYRRGSSSALALVTATCPELRGHIRPNSSSNEETGLLAVSVDPRAGDWYDTVAVYVTAVVPVDEEQGIFELTAGPHFDTNGAIDAGTRRFFVARDGSVHARVGTQSGADPATVDDPIAAECVAGGSNCVAITDTTPSVWPPHPVARRQ